MTVSKENRRTLSLRKEDHPEDQYMPGGTQGFQNNHMRFKEAPRVNTASMRFKLIVAILKNSQALATLRRSMSVPKTKGVSGDNPTLGELNAVYQSQSEILKARDIEPALVG